MTTPIQHGTATGYGQHRHRGEVACEACLIAVREYNRSHAEQAKFSQKVTNRARAELARRHREEYRQIRAQVRADLELDRTMQGVSL